MVRVAQSGRARYRVHVLHFLTREQYLLADVTIARLRDLGVNDEQVMVRTHLGNILQAGDNVWGSG